MLLRSLLTILFLTILASAQTGKVLYTTYCSACHAPDGKGANNGAFPPLAKSLWLHGEPERAIQIALHGLAGEVEVLEKTYNLQMPPQGAMLNDQQLASILTYTRSSWGNKESAVTAAQVAVVRKMSANRSEMWTAKSLLKIHPFPNSDSPIKNLIRSTYLGQWKKLPDYSKLKSVSVEEEADGFLNLYDIEAKDNFGVVWEGDLQVQETGAYSFILDSNDGSALYLDGKKIIELNSTGPLYTRRQGEKVELKKGTIPIRVEYFEVSGAQDIVLLWRGPGISGSQWMSVKPKTKRTPAPVIDLTPTGKESAIYNNFLNGTTPRSIAIGHPNGANFAFSTSNCSLNLLWSGKFINAGKHWTSRGVGRVDPHGKNLVNLGDTGFVSDDPVQFKGHTMDKLRRPTFSYTVGQSIITDAIMPGQSLNTLVRTITIKGDKPLTLNVVQGISVTSPEKATYIIAKKWVLNTAEPPTTLSQDSLQLVLAPGTHTLTYTLLP
jgi:cytochrome c553